MKKFVVSTLLSVLFLLTSCEYGVENQNLNISSPESKYIENQVKFAQTYKPWNIAESDTHYYHIHGNFLYSISKADGIIRVLDNNPDTLDDKETLPSKQAESNAFFNSPRTVQYNNGNLYVLASKKNNEASQNTSIEEIYQDCLYEVRIDGSGQKELFVSRKELYSAFVHNDYFYFSTSDIWELMDKLRSGDIEQTELNNLSYKVERVPISNTSSEPELIYKGSGPGYVESMKFIGDKLHFSDYTLARKEQGHEVTLISNVTKKICDLDTLDIENAVQIQSNNSDKVLTSSDMVPAKDGYMYIYNEIDKEFLELSHDEQFALLNNNKIQFPEKYLVKANSDGKVIEKTKLSDKFNESGILNGYNSYLCLDNITWFLGKLANERVLQILDNKGNLLAEVTPPEGSGMIVGMDDNYIFIEVLTEDNSTSGIYRLNLDNIGEEDFVFEPFFVGR